MGEMGAASIFAEMARPAGKSMAAAAFGEDRRRSHWKPVARAPTHRLLRSYYHSISTLSFQRSSKTRLLREPGKARRSPPRITRRPKKTHHGLDG
jgi:hypothetical protein